MLLHGGALRRPASRPSAAAVARRAAGSLASLLLLCAIVAAAAEPNDLSMRHAGRSLHVPRHLLATPPAAPIIDNIGIVSGQPLLYVDVRVPAANGGSAITEYEVTGIPVGGVAAGRPRILATGAGAITPGRNNRRFTFAEFPKGEAYLFTARARNQVGYGASSSPPTPFTTPLERVPGMPTLAITQLSDGMYLDVTPTTTEAGLTYVLEGHPDGWETPSRPRIVITGAGQPVPAPPGSSSNGQPGRAGASPPSMRRFKITGYLPNTVYRFTAAARNAAGQGPESVPRIMFYDCTSDYTDSGSGCVLKCPVIPGCAAYSNADCSCRQCSAGYGNCDSTSPDCETDLRTSNSHCGKCGTRCSGGKTCQSGSCKCPSGTYECGGTCIANTKCCRTASAVCPPANTNCKCSAGNSVCPKNGGACQCASGYGNCDSTSPDCETDLRTSNSHCGKCGTRCSGGKTCQSGSCKCPSGTYECGGTCIANAKCCRTASAVCPPANPNCKCSAGNNACPRDGGTCQCAAGYGNCDSTSPDCETDLRSSNIHCGKCGASCVFFENCRSGVCVAPIGHPLATGFNSVGQLGDGTTRDRASPVRVTDRGKVSNSTFLAVGSSHSCVATNFGADAAMCWGGGESGQLGDGTTVDQRTVPAPVTGAHTKFTMVASGNEHTCGVLAGSKQVACWGVGYDFQLGTGDDSNAAQPTLISDGGASTYTSVGCGSQHSCALRTDGTALCWGGNSDGQSGQPSGQSVQVPTVVKGQKFRQLALGGGHTCGLRASDNRAMCWGRGEFLGAGTTDNNATPVDVFGGLQFARIAGGFFHTCGVLFNSSCVCWGTNQFGQLGDGTQTDRLVPVPVLGNLQFNNIAVGVAHTCGLLRNGSVACWGDNTAGQFGDGRPTLTRILAPTVIPGGRTFSAVAAGVLSKHTLFLP